MDNFYLNKNEQTSGEHEVHRSGCYWLTLMTNKEYLGIQLSSSAAIAKAKSLHLFWKIDGCATCCPESNHG